MSSSIAAQIEAARRALLEAVTRGEPLTIVKAPPGSGKTYMIREAAALLRAGEGRVAIAAQTNTQADDICRMLALEFADFEVVRFHSAALQPIDIGRSVRWESDKNELPEGPCIVVGTSAKWGTVDLPAHFDYLLVDEAWQMSWSDFMLLGQVAPRFVLVGDPGQIDPVLAVDGSRWVTAERPPYAPAPELLLQAETAPASETLTLPASRRLPPDSVEIVRSFYDFDFGALAKPAERTYAPKKGGKAPVDLALDLLTSGSLAGLTLPTPAGGPPLEEDIALATLAAEVAERLLTRGGSSTVGEMNEKLEPKHVGIAATHRIMNARVTEALPNQLRNAIRVDTPERWQGLECRFMIIVHPISGTTDPSAFDLETGRLCVMASRHQVGLIILSRDHLGATLDEYSPMAEQGVGLPDRAGRGHAVHSRFWEQLTGAGRVVAAG